MMNTKRNYTPLLFVGSRFSSRENGLLSQIGQQITSIHQSINQNKYEYIEVNQTHTTLTIEQVRELQKQLAYAAHEATPRIVVLHGLDTASIPAQNALLKLLEEPPQHTVVCATALSTQPILATILSRVRSIHSNTPVTGSHKTDTPPELASQIPTLPTLSHRELTELADANSDTAAALNFLTTALSYWHGELSNTYDIKRVQKVLFFLQRAYDQVKKNANTKLALEHALFEIKALFS